MTHRETNLLRLANARNDLPALVTAAILEGETELPTLAANDAAFAVRGE